MKRILLLIFLLSLMATVVACGGEDQPESVQQPIVAVATDTPLPAIDAPTATSAPAELPAPVIVLGGDQSTPTATVVEDSAETIPTAIPGLIGPDFPENVNPLTGETVSDPTVLQRRPLAVKVSNYPPVVRPQAGLSDADIVFEHYAEGGATRFTAIFFGKDADRIGSIRSGRLIDLEIPKMYDAAFAYSGASGPVRLRFRDSSFFDRVISPDFGHDGFYRVEDPNKAFEHTLFTDTFFLRNILDAREVNVPPNFQNGMVFSEEIPTNSTAATTIDVKYGATRAFWQYNSATNRYERWTDGIQQVDTNNGQALTFRNVVVLAINHVNTDIIEDSLGSPSIEIQAWGEGPASIFRDGQRIEGKWLRQDPNDMLTFVDLEGNPLPLGIGNTFVQIVPLGFSGLTVTE